MFKRAIGFVKKHAVSVGLVLAGGALAGLGELLYHKNDDSSVIDTTATPSVAVAEICEMASEQTVDIETTETLTTEETAPTEQ